MNFLYDTEEETFRQKMRKLILEEPLDKFTIEKEDDCYGSGGHSYSFLRMMGRKGLLGLTWPKEYGGSNESPMKQLILWEELACARVPSEASFYTEAVGSAIVKFGTEELKRQILPVAAKGEITFCECLSEPNYGSDLFSLQTRALRRGDHYIVNGQKIWTSNGHLARYGIVAVRIKPDVPGPKGVGALLVDLKSPGVTVRRLLSMAGEYDFNEIFFEDVAVPVMNSLGGEEKGMLAALESVEWDRLWGRSMQGVFLKSLLEEFVVLINEMVLNDPIVKDQLARLAIECDICTLLFRHLIWKHSQGMPVNYEHCQGKIFADELCQRFFNITSNILGAYGQLGRRYDKAPMKGLLPHGLLNSVGHTIAGGTSEINRSTVATRGLGLPRK